MDNDIVGRVKSFSLIPICDYLYRSVMFMSDDLAGTMLAGEKPTDVVKSISISIATGFLNTVTRYHLQSSGMALAGTSPKTR